MAYKVLSDSEISKINFEFELICNEILDLCDINNVFGILIPGVLYVNKGKIEITCGLSYSPDGDAYNKWKLLFKRKKSGRLKTGFRVSIEDRINFIKSYNEEYREQILSTISEVNADYDLNGLYYNLAEYLSPYNSDEELSCKNEAETKTFVKKRSF